MLKMISRFAASPFSGYALIALLIAAAGAGYWFWSELKEFGSLQATAQSQEQEIKDQKATIEQLSKANAQKDSVLEHQMAFAQALERSFSTKRQQLQEARSNADQALRECMSMHVAAGMRFGASREDGSGEDKARSQLDEKLPDADT